MGLAINFDEICIYLLTKTRHFINIDKKHDGGYMIDIEKMKEKLKDAMVYVEGGSFTMGSDVGLETEKPAHPATVSSFYINKYAVTQREWFEIMFTTPSEIDGDFCPVENISWYDAVNYCNKRSEKESLECCYEINEHEVKCDFTKNGYRLPTESEWEFAMRGGREAKNFKYAGSDDIEEVAWYIDNSNFSSHPVGSKIPNELGLYDMSGNVYEWCWDRYSQYTNEERVDYKGPEAGDNRVFRGGSWSSIKEYCTLANRYYNKAEKTVFNIGLRLVRTSLD